MGRVICLGDSVDYSELDLPERLLTEQESKEVEQWRHPEEGFLAAASILSPPKHTIKAGGVTMGLLSGDQSRPWGNLLAMSSGKCSLLS